MGEQNPTTSELIEQLTTYTDLSEREAEVVVHMADEIERCDTATEAKQAVGRGLGIEPSSVDTYYRRALEKFGRAVQLREIADKELSHIFRADPLTEEGAGELECPDCGAMDWDYLDMGDHGFSLSCNDCGWEQVG